MREGFAGIVAVGLLMIWLAGTAAATQDSKGNPEAAKLRNPTPATPESIAAGLKIYQRHCRVCHGPDGKAMRRLEDGPAASNLADDHWEYGSTDGEIFWVIQRGVPPEMVMAAWEEQIPDADIWHLVNYVRTLSAKP